MHLFFGRCRTLGSCFVMIDESLSLVIATRNESENIEKIIKELSSVLSRLPLRSEIVVADFSEDNTLELAVSAAESCSIKVIPIKLDLPGRGYAVRKGVDASNSNLICILDGDGNHDPKYLPKMLKVYEPGSIVAPSRFPPFGWSEEHTFLHFFGNRLMITSFNLLFGSHISDITNGFYLMSRNDWKALDLNSVKWSLDVQIICQAMKRGIDIIEIPYYEPKRQGGHASLNIVTAFWRISGRLVLELIKK